MAARNRGRWPAEIACDESSPLWREGRHCCLRRFTDTVQILYAHTRFVRGLWRLDDAREWRCHDTHAYGAVTCAPDAVSADDHLWWHFRHHVAEDVVRAVRGFDDFDGALYDAQIHFGLFLGDSTEPFWHAQLQRWRSRRQPAHWGPCMWQREEAMRVLERLLLS